MRVSPRDIACLSGLSTIWGASFLFIKIAVATVPPATLVAGRLAGAAVLLAAIAAVRGVRLPTELRAWLPFAAIGVTGNVVPFFLIALGETKVDSALAAILIGLTPIFTVLLAHRFTGDERLDRGRLAAVALGFASLVVLVGPSVLAGLGSEIWAQAAIALAAACYAGTAVYGRLPARASPEVTATASTIAAALLAVPLSLTIDRPWELAPSADAIGAVAALAVLSTALGALMFFSLLASGGATFAALTNYLIPLCGVGWGVVFLGERPGPAAGLALAMILVSVGLASRGARPVLRRTGPARPASNRDPAGARAPTARP
jgi:drug/metabolite transporter (DMT)-like permease